MSNISERVTKRVFASLGGFRLQHADGKRCDEFSWALRQLIALVCRQYEKDLNDFLAGTRCEKLRQDHTSWLIEDAANLFWNALGTFSSKVAELESLLVQHQPIACATSIRYFHHFPHILVHTRELRRAERQIPARSTRINRKRRVQSWTPYLFDLRLPPSLSDVNPDEDDDDGSR